MIYRTLFVATETRVNFPQGTLCIGTIEADSQDEAASTAEANFGSQFRLLGIADDTIASNGHGSRVKSVKLVVTSTVTVNGGLLLSDL